MPVNYATPAPEALFPVAGVRLGTAEAGIRKKDRRDLTLIEFAPGSRAAGVFTQNRCCAAPVTVCRDHLANDCSLSLNPRPAQLYRHCLAPLYRSLCSSSIGGSVVLQDAKRIVEHLGERGNNDVFQLKRRDAHAFSVSL